MGRQRERRETAGTDGGPVPGIHTIDTGTCELVHDRFNPNGWVLHINGVPSSHIDLTDPARLAVFEDLAEDPLVKAVIVSINSPGGTTAGGEELYEALGRLRAEKPVVAVISELGASAAYMTAIATAHCHGMCRST